MKQLFTIALAAALASGPALADAASLGTATGANGAVQFDVTSLKRTEGDTVTLRFRVRNIGDDTYAVTVINMRLIDLIGRRIYSPGVASPFCGVPVAKEVVCYAIFGAPPASATKINVQFYEADLISGVPIGEP